MSSSSGRPGLARTWFHVGLGLLAIVVAGLLTGWAVSRGDGPQTRTGGDEESQSPAPSITSPSASPTTPRQTLARSIRQSESGVVRIESSTCDSLVSGSGFLVGPDLVATVAHVVDDARTIAVRNDDGSARAEVIGIDPVQDLALLRLSHPVDGYIFELAKREPLNATRVASIGYPDGKPRSNTQGAISAVGRRIEFDQYVIEDLIQFDAATSAGNSGGPVIDRRGLVVGLTEASAVWANDVNYAVSATSAAPLLQAWRESPSPVRAPDCTSPTDEVIRTDSVHPDAPGIAWTFAAYFGGINEGDEGQSWGGYDRAWRALSGRQRGNYISFADFREKQSTSTIEDAVLEKVDHIDEVVDTADVRFTSRQDSEHGPNGQTCTRWHLRYTVRLDTGSWTIENAEPIGNPPSRCP